MWTVSLDQYVTGNLKTHKPLDICFPINCIHKKKEEPVICKPLIGTYIFKLYYKFIWCKIVTNDKTLSGSVEYTLGKNHFSSSNRQSRRTLAPSPALAHIYLSLKMKLSSHDSPFFPFVCLISTPFTNKYLPKQGNSELTKSTQAHTQTDKKECEVIHGWPSLKGCDAIRKRKTHKQHYAQNERTSSFFCLLLLCTCVWSTFNFLPGTFSVKKAFKKKEEMPQGRQLCLKHWIIITLLSQTRAKRAAALCGSSQ